MQGLVYLFVALSGLGLGVAAYFALAFTPIEAGLLGLMVILAGIFFHERTLRHRAESRLEKGIQELGRLLSTDAQAGQLLSQRVKALVDLDLGSRLDVLEADISVLGTVTRQVAEAVSDLENAHAATASKDDGTTSPKKPEASEGPKAPTVALADVRRLIEGGQLVHHTQSIVTLPQRKLYAFEMIPRLRLDDGKLADPPDYMPYRNKDGATVVRRVDRICAEQAIAIVRRARTIQDPVHMLVPLTATSLDNAVAVDQLLTLLAANRAVSPDLMFALEYQDWDELDTKRGAALDRIVEQGVGIAIRDAQSLRLDFAKLSARGVKMISANATTFLESPAKLSDFHSADINDYVKRFGIALCMEQVRNDQQILALLDDGIGLAQGPGIAKVGPIRHDLREDEKEEMPKRAAR